MFNVMFFTYFDAVFYACRVLEWQDIAYYYVVVVAYACFIVFNRTFSHEKKKKKKNLEKCVIGVAMFTFFKAAFGSDAINDNNRKGGRCFSKHPFA